MILVLVLVLLLYICNNVCSQDILQVGDNKPIVKLVIYDRVAGYLNWLQDWFIDSARDNCSTICLISQKKTDIYDADIVLYHGPTHRSSITGKGRVTIMGPLSTSKSLNILLSLEQPKYAPILNDKEKLNRFDAVATYSQQALFPNTKIPNIPLTYYPLNIMNINAIMHAPRPFKSKNGYGTGVNVAVFISNCKTAGAYERFSFLQDLMNSIKIHSYGGCLHNMDEPKIPDDPKFLPVAQRRARKIKILSNYKFYLAFENTDEEDYVSGIINIITIIRIIIIIIIIIVIIRKGIRRFICWYGTCI